MHVGQARKWKTRLTFSRNRIDDEHEKEQWKMQQPQKMKNEKMKGKNGTKLPFENMFLVFLSR